MFAFKHHVAFETCEINIRKYNEKYYQCTQVCLNPKNIVYPIKYTYINYILSCHNSRTAMSQPIVEILYK